LPDRSGSVQHATAFFRLNRSLPGFLGLPAIVSTTDLIASLPRQIGETLARLGGLSVYDCLVPISGFTVKQHWHARYHHDAANRWLRGVCAALFMQHSPRERTQAMTLHAISQRGIHGSGTDQYSSVTQRWPIACRIEPKKARSSSDASSLR
jgi:transposase InsO family protein